MDDVDEKGQARTAGAAPGPPPGAGRASPPLRESGVFRADPDLQDTGTLRMRPQARRRRGLFRLPHVSRAVALPVLAVLVLLGPLLGLLTYQTVARRERERLDMHFGDFLLEKATTLEQRALSIVEALHSVKSFYDCSDVVTRPEFSMFTEDAISRHEGIQAMEWIPCVREQDRQALRERASAEGVPDFGITEGNSRDLLHPAESRDVYFPVFYVAPFEGNERALGFDVRSEPIRRVAFEEAVRSGEATLTDPVSLVQEEGTILGILGFLPVYSKEAAGSDAEKALEGLVCVVLRVDDLLRDAVDHRDAEGTELMAFDLVDTDTTAGPLVLCRNACEAPYDPSEELPWTHSHALEIGGQLWELRARPTEAFLAARRGPQPVVVALSVVLGWWLLCGLLWVVARWARDRDAKKQAQFVSSVLASLSEGVVVANQDGQIQLSNEAAEQLTGMVDQRVPPEEWSRTYGIYQPDGVTPYPPDELPLARAMRGERVQDEHIFIRSPGDGSGRWLRISANPLRDKDEKTAGSVIVLRDVTERKKSEAAILRLSNAVEQTADAVFITDRAGRIEYVNPGFEETTGYAKADVIGQRPSILKSGLHEDQHYRELWSTVLAGEVYRGSTTNRRKDGQVYHTDQTVTPMTDSEGRVTHFVSVSKDTTEKRKRQEQQYEMRMAAVVQKKLFPQHPPTLEGLDIAGAVLPASETSGDYFDYVDPEDGRIVLAIGDVSGHGFGPALLMAETRAYLRSLVRSRAELDHVLHSLNGTLMEDLRSEHFVTLLLASIDTVTSRLVHANAGHEPGYVLDAEGAVKAELAGTGAILGAFADSTYTRGREIQLVPGDVAILLTDGVTESQAPNGDFFGVERALGAVREHRGGSAKEIVDGLLGAVRSFTRVEERRDDTTVVVCKALPRTP